MDCYYFVVSIEIPHIEGEDIANSMCTYRGDQLRIVYLHT